MSDKLMISTSTNYHSVQQIRASSYDGLALKLTIVGDTEASDRQSNQAEINLFFEEIGRTLVERLISAINDAANFIDEPPQPIDDGSCDPLYGQGKPKTTEELRQVLVDLIPDVREISNEAAHTLRRAVDRLDEEIARAKG